MPGIRETWVRVSTGARRSWRRTRTAAAEGGALSRQNFFVQILDKPAWVVYIVDITTKRKQSKKESAG